MEIFRFMSRKEFYKLINDEILINKTKHKGYTNSIGFCFMEGNPEECYEFLSGIVSNEICVVFETNIKLNKTYGIYADPYGSFFDTITEDEYCIDKYNKYNFKIKKMAIPDYSGSFKWYKDINSFCNKLAEIEEEEKEEKKRIKQIEKAEKEIETNSSNKLMELFFNNGCKIEEIILKKDNESYKFKNIRITDIEVNSYPLDFDRELKFVTHIRL